jgi:hypothetical protein
MSFSDLESRSRSTIHILCLLLGNLHAKKLEVWQPRRRSPNSGPEIDGTADLKTKNTSGLTRVLDFNT